MSIKIKKYKMSEMEKTITRSIESIIADNFYRLGKKSFTIEEVKTDFMIDYLWKTNINENIIFNTIEKLLKRNIIKKYNENYFLI